MTARLSTAAPICDAGGRATSVWAAAWRDLSARAASSVALPQVQRVAILPAGAASFELAAALRTAIVYTATPAAFRGVRAGEAIVSPTGAPLPGFVQVFNRISEAY